ncbi:MAG: molybdopterin-dependent oxidoreductase [Gemmatimonas sp.]|nr:molybdopterin-dependent oxidoreductase [Gemmatimonas sp.]
MNQNPIHSTRAGAPFSRREVIRGLGLAAVGLAVTPVRGWPTYWFRSDDDVVPFTDIPDDFTGRRPGDEDHPGAGLIAQDLRELDSWITPVADFFVVDHYGHPVLDAATYRLRVGGLVRTPIELDLSALRSRPRVERTTVFECGGNSRGLIHGMVGNATWAGAELLPILESAGWTDDAREVHFWAADTGTEEIRDNEYEQNFARSMSLDQIRETQPILAYEMNGEPLTVVHGSPVRLIVPGWYGVCQVKWLERIEFSADRLMTRFMARDYVTLMGREVDGNVEWVETSVTRQRPKSVIARVTRNEDLFTIFGVAWTDGTPLDRVDLQIDGGDWTAATLEAPENPHAWTFFRLEVPGLANGEHTLASRATDAGAQTQPDNLDLKETRWENNEIFHRTILVS